MHPPHFQYRPLVSLPVSSTVPCSKSATMEGTTVTLMDRSYACLNTLAMLQVSDQSFWAPPVRLYWYEEAGWT